VLHYISFDRNHSDELHAVFYENLHFVEFFVLLNTNPLVDIHVGGWILIYLCTADFTVKTSYETNSQLITNQLHCLKALSHETDTRKM
jgi:K+ transporter